MPFTGSHPAAVLPLMRLGLVPSALVIGSMSPDLLYYVPLSPGLEASTATLSHSSPGIVTLDLALGYLSFVVWHLLVVPFAVAAAPESLRSRLAPELPIPPRIRLTGLRNTALVLLSVVVGSITHVFWDEFTHVDRWGYHHVGWLAAMHGPLEGYRWAQYGSGVVGGLVIVLAVRQWWRTAEVADPELSPQRVPALNRTAAAQVWLCIGGAALIAAVAGFVISITGSGPRRALFVTATWGGGAGLAVILLFSIWSGVRRLTMGRLV